MAGSTKVVDPAFEGAGQADGLEVWRIENFQPVRVPKSDVGKFYTGDSYIVLKTTVLKSGAFQYDVHFWLGKATSQDEAGTAAIKTVELDTVLDDRAVQYREVQGHETDKFLSYFKPCIIPLEGGVASGFKQVEKENFEPRLYTCEGRRVVRVKQVPYSRSTLNHDDVFILDTESKIYQFNGSSSSIQERAKALEVVQYIKETYHDGTCDVAVIDDGEVDDETDTEEFWNLFGGFGSIGNRAASEEDSVPEASAGKLYIVEEGQLNQIDSTPLTKDLLESSKGYVLDCGAEIYVWTGRTTSLEERKAAIGAAEELLSSQNRPKHTHITRVIEGSETLPFCTNFALWPQGDEAEDGRGKVSDMVKQHIAKASKKEEVPPLFDSNGKLEVWRINGSEKTAVAPEEVGKFFSGDCYVAVYTNNGEGKDEYFLYSWVGKSSAEEDKTAAFQVVSQTASTHGGRPVQGRIVEGNEPPEFIGLFQAFYVLKGGLSSGYQTKAADEGLEDETYTENGFALFQVRGTGPHNSKAVQVSQDVAELNSCYCYILQSGTSLYVWNGSSSIPEEQEVAANLAKSLKPGSAAEVLTEGSEPSEFWDALGGRKSYTCHPEIKKAGKHPRLFACSIVRGKLEATEVFNFAQNDLLSEDVLLLDTYDEVFIWVGENADVKEKQQAFDMAHKYVERAAVREGLPLSVPIYRVTEGNEPFFFCKYFKDWDAVKALAHGDSFQKRLSALFGKAAKSSKTSGASQKGEAVSALSSSLSGCKVDDSAGRENAGAGEYISYERLKADSDDPAPGVDAERRESYLSPEEFKKLFGMESDQFYKLPKWKQEMQKKALDLF